MGIVETSAREKRRKRDLRTAALVAVGTVGVLAVAAVAPNLVRLLETTGVNAKLRYQTLRVLSRLKQKGEIEFVEHAGKKSVRLTEKGERTFALHKQKLALAPGKKRKWDGRYRLVIFDIPEKRRKAREYLRLEMREVGFLRVQNSAWLYPYDCEEFVALLKADLHLGKNVLYAVVDEIENSAWMHKHFALPT